MVANNISHTRFFPWVRKMKPVSNRNETENEQPGILWLFDNNYIIFDGFTKSQWNRKDYMSYNIFE